jgi:hypothetical protein
LRHYAIIAPLLLLSACYADVVEEENALLLKEQYFLRQEISKLEHQDAEIQRFLALLLAERALYALDRLGLRPRNIKLTHDGLEFVGDLNGQTRRTPEARTQSNPKTKNGRNAPAHSKKSAVGGQ